MSWQASATANTQAWAAAEASLTARLNESEGNAAGAAEREKRAWEKVQAAHTRLAASAAALDALKTELAEADAGGQSTFWVFVVSQEKPIFLFPAL